VLAVSKADRSARNVTDDGRQPERAVACGLRRTIKQATEGIFPGSQRAAWRGEVIHWKQIDEFIEPNWEKVGTTAAAHLFWRGSKKPVFGFIRDGELFDYKWLYVCDANKVTHFSEINGPESNVVEMQAFRPDDAE
jgi:hypothetical protein